jgi:hypothetical protein
MHEPSLARHIRVLALDVPLFMLTQAHQQVLVGTGAYARRATVAASPAIPIVRLARTFAHARRLGRGAGFLARVVPTLGIGLVADGIGQMAGYALGAGDAHARMAEYEWHRTNHTPRRQSTRAT